MDNRIVAAAVLLLLLGWWFQNVYRAPAPMNAPAPAPAAVAAPAVVAAGSQQQQPEPMTIVKPISSSEYARLGYLTDNQGMSLPLFGRASLTSRERFQYYVLTTDQQPIRLVARPSG
ncbi:hypothetical protein COO60DRAFT_1644265 [Scenedesmus sp. NREL 46B-D3]|nr:hypothetical protein COO60DRAFT_1644265 [Scenedesmus sp. NREL 46B-D3]